MLKTIKKRFEKAPFIIAAVLLFCLLAVPTLSGRASATGQITTRSLTISSSKPSATGVNYTFVFTPPSATVLQSFDVEVCDAAVGTCNHPSGYSVSSSTINQPTVGCGDTSGWSVNTATQYHLRMKKTGASAAPSGAACTLVWHSVTNQSATNTAFFERITTYSDDAWTTPVDAGTTASATTIDSGAPGYGLQASAAVAEVLNFCVGATTVDDSGTTDPTPTNHDCTDITGTVVNLGILDTTHVNVTPVTTNCSATGCSKNGIAMVRSNAFNGTAVYYDAVQQSSGTNHTGDLRVAGATCDGSGNNASTSVVDSCFNNSTSQATFPAGTERWGMTVSGVNCKSASSYGSCSGTTDSHLARDAAYDGNGTSSYVSEADQSVTTTSSNGYAWDESGTSTLLATSSGAGVKQIDDEALILKFAATPSITTPFGSYAGYADYVCVATY